jgi:hypothetical protein
MMTGATCISAPASSLKVGQHDVLGGVEEVSKVATFQSFKVGELSWPF